MEGEYMIPSLRLTYELFKLSPMPPHTHGLRIASLGTASIWYQKHNHYDFWVPSPLHLMDPTWKLKFHHYISQVHKSHLLLGERTHFVSAILGSDGHLQHLGNTRVTLGS